MAVEPQTELDWIPSLSSSPLTCTSDTASVTAVTTHVVWSSSVGQPEMLNATSHTAGAWNQLLDQRTGSGNIITSDNSGAKSRVETDDNANWTKDGGGGGSQTDGRPTQSLLSYGVERLPPEVTSEAAGSHVFSDVDYHVLRRHVMQGDPDDHVISTDRKSLDSRKLILVFSPWSCLQTLCVPWYLSTCHPRVT